MTSPCVPDAGSSDEELARRALAGAQRAKLRAAIEELAEEHRAVLRLVHEDGLRLVDAAAVMGRSPEAVRMLYGRAIAALADRVSRRD